MSRPDFEAAMRDIRRGLVKSNGGQKAENAATSAYRAMVAAGEAPSLKVKYLKGKYLKQVRK